MTPDLETEGASPAPLLKHETDEERLLREEAERLELVLRDRKEELAHTEAEWNEFRERYIEAVGGGYAELEEIERQIAEFEPAPAPEPEEQADEEEEPEEVAAAHEGAAARGLKQVRKLFWRVAKLLHPDLAADDAERDRRHELMTEASRAYRDGDADRLSSLLDDEGDAAASPAPEREELAALRSRVAALRREVRRVETDLNHFAESPFFQVKVRCDDAARRGRDLLAEMRTHVADQITDARRRLDVLRTAAGATAPTAPEHKQEVGG